MILKSLVGVRVAKISIVLCAGLPPKDISVSIPYGKDKYWKTPLMIKGDSAQTWGTRDFFSDPPKTYRASMNGQFYITYDEGVLGFMLGEANGKVGETELEYGNNKSSILGESLNFGITPEEISENKVRVKAKLGAYFGRRKAGAYLGERIGTVIGGASGFMGLHPLLQQGISLLDPSQLENFLASVGDMTSIVSLIGAFLGAGGGATLGASAGAKLGESLVNPLQCEMDLECSIGPNGDLVVTAVGNATTWPIVVASVKCEDKNQVMEKRFVNKLPKEDDYDKPWRWNQLLGQKEPMQPIELKPLDPPK